MVGYFEHEEFQAGRWRVLPRRNAIADGERTVVLEPKTMQVLLCLADRPGQVVSRRELFRIVWPDTTVTDKVLSRAVSLLRRALEDDPRSPRYVRTVSKVGYQWIAPETTGALRPEAGAPAGGRRRSTVRRRIALAGAGLLILATLATRYVVGPAPGDRAAPTAAVTPAIALTSLPGQERFPAISPDGRRVVFSWQPPGESYWRLYIQAVDGERALPLTADGAHAWRAVWSPHGRRLAWTACRDGRLSVHVGPLEEGARLVATGDVVDLPIGRCNVDPATTPALAWSPDGRLLALPLPHDDGLRGGIVGFDLEAGGRRALSHPRPGDWDADPSFDPGGATLAFSRRTAPGRARLMLVRLDDGAEREVAGRDASLAGHGWWRADRLLVASNHAGGRFDLWDVGLVGPMRWYPARGEELRQPAIALDAGRLVYESWSFDADLWLAPVDGAPRRLPISSSVWDGAPALAPDGRRLAFVSVRSGSPELWLGDLAGDAPRRLTHLAGPLLRDPCWSPDGRRIALIAQRVRASELIVVDVDGAKVERVLEVEDRLAAPGFSPDGTALWFGRSIGGRWAVWTVALHGGEMRRLIGLDAVSARSAPDGAAIYFTRAGQTGLWRRGMRETDATAQRIVDDLAVFDAANWQVTPEGILFPRRTGPESALLARWDPATGAIVPLRSLPWPPLAGHLALTISAAGDAVLVHVERATSDIMIARLVDASWPG